MLTMLLGGLWHGAFWNFVIWGGMHGAALIAHREWQRYTEGFSAKFKKVMAWLAVPLTFYWVCITWIFFRSSPVVNEKTKELEATGFEIARKILDSFVLFDSHGKRTFTIWCLVLVVVLALVHWLNSRQVFATWWRRVPDWAYAAILGAGFALALFFKPVVYRAFIYFQF